MNFDSIPSAVRVPFTYVEFSNSESSSASSVQVYKLLLIGQKLASGTQPALTPIRIQSKKQANTLFGAGSMLARMVHKALDANSFTEMHAIAVEDVGAGVAAAGNITLTGTATADGTLSVYVGGQLISAPVLQGDTAAEVAASLAAAGASLTDSVATSAVNGTTNTRVDFTFRHKGLAGNDTPISLNYNGETTPAGLTAAITQFTGGTTNPLIDPVWNAIGDEQFRTIVTPYNDAANLTSITTELARRWGPLLTNDGHAFAVSNLSTGLVVDEFSEQNSPHLTIMSNAGSPTPSFEAAAVLGAVVAFNSPIDQARPMQTLVLPGVLPPTMKDRPLLAERNVLLYSGIATTTIDGNGQVRIERLITTYKEDGAGNPDESYLDYETLAILSYIRYDFRAFFGRRYPRHKLAANGTRFAPGQLVMTPSLAKAEAIGLFSNWELAGLVENSAQFERDLIVEISPTNPNRLDFYLPPNIINRLIVLAAKIAFRA